MPSPTYKFGDFDLDTSRFELRWQDRPLKLERIPMELLILLLEKDGQVASRQEIVDRLWGKDVFVDTEHGINTAIRKIRRVLRDDPERPRFVLTVTGKGYRFVAETKNSSLPASPAAERSTAAELGVVSDVSLNISPAAPSSTIPSPGVAAPPLGSVPSREKSSGKMLAATALVSILILGTLVGVNAGGIRDRLFPGSHARQIHSIAVLPLANLSGDASQEYFADGMTDELITALAKNRNLRVVSRTSVMQYKGVNRPVRDIAHELNVDGILEGSVERSANRVHMTVQLIYALTDTHLWAQSYNRDETQALSLPEELSQIVAKEIKAATSEAPVQRYISPEAHDAYLHGRYFWFTFDTAKTLPYFEKAIQLQPDYAAAWSGLADTYAIQVDDAPPQPLLAKSGDAARKAVELDDSLAEGHVSLGGWYLESWDLLHADAELRRAIELDPNRAESHYLRHYILLILNRPEEALQEEKRAVELDPFARSWGLGRCYIQLRQFDAAIDELHMQSVARPADASPHKFLALAYWLKGMEKESQQELEKGFELEHNHEGLAAARRAYATGGPTAVAQWEATVTKARSREEYISAWDIAQNVALTRDKDETLQYLEAAYREHLPSLISVQTEPVFDFLHSDERYRTLVNQLGLTPAY